MRVRVRLASARCHQWSVLAVISIVALSCADTATAPLVQPTSLSASATLEGDVRPDTVRNRYVVVLRENVANAAAASAAITAQVGGLRFYVYEAALKGFCSRELANRCC